MKRKILTLVAVAVAVAVILALKTSRNGAASPAGATASQAPSDAIALTRYTVMLFADPREADSNCGCAEVIQLARAAGRRRGVEFEELDIRHAGAQARDHGVRVSPTVLVLGPDGKETRRFEGESSAVIARLRETLTGLGEQATHAAAP